MSYKMISSYFERMNHEKQKQKLIEELTNKIQIVKDLKRECTDYTMVQYYTGYIRAYNDCIDMIIEERYY